METMSSIASAASFLAFLAVLVTMIGLVLRALHRKTKRGWVIGLAVSIGSFIAALIIFNIAEPQRQETSEKQSLEKQPMPSAPARADTLNANPVPDGNSKSAVASSAIRITVIKTEKFAPTSFSRSAMIGDWCTEQQARDLASSAFRQFQAEHQDALRLNLFLYSPGSDPEGEANIVLNGAGEGEPTIATVHWIKPEALKDGLSLDLRKKIYSRLLAAEDRAEQEAEKQVPLGLDKMKPVSRAAIPHMQSAFAMRSKRHMQISDRLTQKSDDDILREFKITQEQLDAVSLEAAENNWKQ